MNVKSFLIAIFSISCSVASFGQSNLLNAKTPSQIGVKSTGQLKSDNDKPWCWYCFATDTTKRRLACTNLSNAR